MAEISSSPPLSKIWKAFPCLAFVVSVLFDRNNSIVVQVAVIFTIRTNQTGVFCRSLSHITALRTMKAGKTPLQQSLPFHTNALLSLKTPRQMPSSISMTTSKVLIHYLFETRIENDSSTQNSIRDVTQNITSYLWPQSAISTSISNRPSIGRYTSTKAIPPMDTYGPAKKRLKTRYYLENKSHAAAV